MQGSPEHLRTSFVPRSGGRPIERGPTRQRPGCRRSGRISPTLSRTTLHSRNSELYLILENFGAWIITKLHFSRKSSKWISSCKIFNSGDSAKSVYSENPSEYSQASEFPGLRIPRPPNSQASKFPGLQIPSAAGAQEPGADVRCEEEAEDSEESSSD